MTVPATRILSWQQLVVEADPQFARDRLQPWVYKMSNGRLFYSPTNPYAPLYPGDLGNDGGVLYLLDSTGWPTSAVVPGAVYNLGGAVGIVPGAVAQPGVAPVTFGNITGSQLLLFGAASWPTTGPESGTLQLWNNGGLACIA